MEIDKEDTLEELNWFPADFPGDEKDEADLKYEGSVAVKSKSAPEESKIKSFIEKVGRMDSKKFSFLSDKLMLLEERDKLIRSSFDKNRLNKGSVKGTCPDMCPEKERLMREVKKMVSVFECGPNGALEEGLAVKQYARSSADQEEPLPHELRPQPVLTMTMAYLINHIVPRIDDPDTNLSAWYDFCWDRLRAIRKDIVQQQLSDPETVAIVEQCARFHIVCFDRFWGSDVTVFDEKINTENLMNCLKILMNLYEDLHNQGLKCPNEAEFNAYMILLKLNSGDLLWEYLNFPFSLQRASEVLEAVKIHMSYNNLLYSQYFRYVLKTSYLNACLMQRYFGHIRLIALGVIVKAFCPPKHSKIPLQLIVESLKFDYEEDAILFCEACGLSFDNKNAEFFVNRSKLTRPEPAFRITTQSSLVTRKRVEFSYAIMGENDLPIYTPHEVHDSFINNTTLGDQATDASDQEEKMLLDNVKRKLLIKQMSNVKGTLSVNKMPLRRSSSVQSCSRKSNLGESVELEERERVKTPSIGKYSDKIIEDVEEMDEDQYLSDSDMVDGSAVSGLFDENEISDEEFMTYETSGSPEIKHPNESPSTLWPSNEIPFKHISPKFFESKPKCTQESSAKNSSFMFEFRPPLPVPSVKSPSPVMKIASHTNGSLKSPLKLSIEQKSALPSVPVTYGQAVKADIPVIKKVPSPPKVDPEMQKLRTCIKEKMKRINAKRYGRLWRDKVRLMRLSESFTPQIHHVSISEYLKAWGRSQSVHSITNRVSVHDKLNNRVKTLLNNSLFEVKNDKLGLIGMRMSEILGEKSLAKASSEGNITSPEAVYWKLVVSLPEGDGGEELKERVRLWAREALEGGAEPPVTRLTKTGVSVTVSAEVLSGLSSASNPSAVLFLRVSGWEAAATTQSRLNAVLSRAAHPLPLHVLDLPSVLPPLPLNSYRLTSSAHNALKSTVILVQSLLFLAHNSFLIYAKTAPISYFIDQFADKFLDALQEDSTNHSGLFKLLSNPNNIIYLYNLFLDKVQNEIVRPYKSNLYGTIVEFHTKLRGRATNKMDSLREADISDINQTFTALKLKPLIWPPDSSTHITRIFKPYFEDLGISCLLSTVLRMINPPDEDDEEEELIPFLMQLQWLHIIEVIIKGTIRSCPKINLTYSEERLNELINSHWWMRCDILLNYEF